jgi:hypothetical protein
MPRPVWKLPFRFRDAPLVIAADDGAMLVQRETGWRQL